jgi:hypothetical protein
MSDKIKVEPFDPVLWANWEERFLAEEAEAHREQQPEEPTEVVARHDRMSSKEVCEHLRWSVSKLRRNVKSRKLAYIKEDGKMWFRRADVERYDKKRYVPEK